MSTPRTLSDRYELGETLGFGGMSEVHSGRDLRLDRDVAVKVLRADLARDPSFYLRFRREAQNAAALNHPAIVAVYDTGEADTPEGPLPYIVMEQVDGETLRDVLRHDGPLTPRRAMEVMGDVCAALDFSHRHGIVHRDVKPANIMINRAGAVKVMDFGIARAIADGTSTMTQTAAVIGTAQYLSPEQARGEQVDARSDVYAAGCVLFELLTGEPPFTGDSPVAVAYQHVREDPRPPSQLNPAVPGTLDSVVLKAMSKNPANRYQSAGEMRTDLVRVLAGQRPTAPSIMTDDDRTEILGAVPVPVGSGRHRDDDPLGGLGVDAAERERTGRRTGLIVLASVVMIALVALIGVFLYQLNGGGRPTQVAVPPVAGQTLNDAQAQISAVKLQSRTNNVPDATVPENTVIRTDPTVGSSVDENSTVQLYVSTGPEQVRVPTVANLPLQQAIDALTVARLTAAPNPAMQPSDTVPAGSVISSTPAAGSSADAQSAVVLVVSSGAQPVRIPSVVGQAQPDAQANLEAAGFVVNPAPVDSAKPAGEVVSQGPEGGTQAPKGATVTINVSSGNRVVVPDLAGVRATEVLARLQGNKYTGGQGNITATMVPVTDPAQVGRVVSQSVPAGTEIEPSAPLSIGVGVSPAPPTSGPLSTVPLPTTTTTTTTTTTKPPGG
jgi:beta-lactam-binding protein with PASTA domain